MWDRIREKIGEALEKAEESFKNIITLGKHNEIKECAREYENALSLLKNLQSKHEDLIVKLDSLIYDFEEERKSAFDACQKSQAILISEIVEIVISFPEIALPENISPIYLEGVSDVKLKESYQANNVGAATKNFSRYLAVNKSAQQQVIKHPMIAVGALMIDGINALMSAAKAASAQLEEILSMQLQVNAFTFRYLEANKKIIRLMSEVNEDRKLISSLLDTLERVKLNLVNIYDDIRYNPSKLGKILRWWRKLFRMNIYSKKEIKKLTDARSLVIETLQNISLILEKMYKL